MSKEHWDKRFSDQDFVYGKNENEFLNKMSGILPASSQVGCFAEGEGRNAVFLAKQGHKVTAYDHSRVGLEKTKKLAEEKGVHVETVEMDLTEQKVEKGQFDAAVMIFGHVPEKDQPFLFDSMIGSLKPGGYLIVEVYSKDQLRYKSGGPDSEKLMYDPIDVLQWIKPYTCLHFYYGEEEVNEGKRHTGRGHVIQLVLKKVIES
ncbi:class I SAM-dependent methyltransferase [Bacillus testis]|uniref:class I SAM-dependent methyltransferase n=1 Tax=Bacillus testis TaxID=1622072 RepID=UPI00067EA092|nr:class I SAM-dependent methyltransferase [Bacillus testis]